MDTLTHGALGGLIASALSKCCHKNNSAGISDHKVVCCVVVAAVFPDCDYLLFWWDPYRFITHWHRGISHSIVMIPVWSVLMGMCLAHIFHHRQQWKILSKWCAIGLISHIIVDLVTLYGTQVFAPVSEYRLALGLFFDIDPYIAGLSIVFLVGGYRRPSIARVGLFVILLYVLFQLSMRHVAFTIANDNKGQNAIQVYALPQPISPAHWKLVVSYPHYYEVGYLNVASSIPWQRFAKMINLSSIFEPYKRSQYLDWRRVYRFGISEEDRQLSADAWRQPAFSAFRRFSSLPVLYRIDRTSNQACVWFTDIRYVLPNMTPPFRYGSCRSSNQAPWRLFRLMRWADNDRQPITQ